MDIIARRLALKVTRWLHSKVPFLAIFNHDHDSRVGVQPRPRSFDARLERALAVPMLDASVATAADMITVNIELAHSSCRACSAAENKWS